MAERTHLIVHAGFPKTGSSALQYWLDTNASALADAGVFYPREGRSAEDAPGHITAGNGKLLTHYLVPKLRHAHFDMSGFRDKFRRIFLPSEGGTILISREQIGACDADMLQKFKDEIVPDVELTFLVFMRNIYDIARASWTQRIKRHVVKTNLKEYVATFGSHVGNLQTMIDVLGRERVIVLHYESVAHDLVGAFLSAIGVDPTIGAPRSSIGRVNRSLSDVEARVLMECGQVHGQRKLARLLSNHFMDRYRNSPSPHTPDPEIISILARRHARKIRWVNETFFDGEDVFGVGGQPRPPRQRAGSVEMSEAQVWREVASVLAREFSAKLGEGGQRKIMELVSDHLADKEFDGVLTNTRASDAANNSLAEVASKMGRANDALFGEPGELEGSGLPPRKPEDDQNDASDDLPWRAMALVLAKAFSARIGPRPSREELRKGLGKRGRMTIDDQGDLVWFRSRA